MKKKPPQKAVYWFHSESDMAPYYPGMTVKARVLFIPVLGFGVAFVFTPWALLPYIRRFDWNGAFEIPRRPKHFRLVRQ
jgi:hypothetical protein